MRRILESLMGGVINVAFDTKPESVKGAIMVSGMVSAALAAGVSAAMMSRKESNREASYPHAAEILAARAPGGVLSRDDI